MYAKLIKRIACYITKQAKCLLQWAALKDSTAQHEEKTESNIQFTIVRLVMRTHSHTEKSYRRTHCQHIHFITDLGKEFQLL